MLLVSRRHWIKITQRINWKDEKCCLESGMLDIEIMDGVRAINWDSWRMLKN